MLWQRAAVRRRVGFVFEVVSVIGKADDRPLWGGSGGCQAVAVGFPYLHAALPERLFISVSLAVLNSSPTMPRRINQVLIKNFLFSDVLFLGLAVLTSFAIWESARAS